MATFYLDYEGGNDANDGTSFAQRWKTITAGATAARIAPGDTIRVMGSPAPTSLGINATWTNKSPTVSLASALNVLITDCNSAWTASANVTCTANTSTYRTSTGAAQQAVAAGFTTGKIAYFDLGSNQDYSAYQGVTFWIAFTTGTLAAGVLTLDLCSDALGATPVDTLAIPAVSQTGQWIPVYIDKGSALGASIRSISVNAISDPGTVTFLFDNISTVKAAGNDALNLQSLIGKNTGAQEYWWAVRAINGTTVTIDSSPGMAVPSTTSRGYYGTTESVTTYKRETIKTDLVAATTTVVQAVQDSGSVGSLITFSGGWNRTDMSTQTLETWFDGRSGFGHGLYNNAKTYLKYEKINLVRYFRGYHFDSFVGHEHSLLYSGHCTNAGLYVNNAAGGTVPLGDIHVWGCNNAGVENINGDSVSIALLRIISCASASVQSGWVLTSGTVWRITQLDCHNASWYGLIGTSGTWQKFWFGTINAHDNGNGGIWCAPDIIDCRIDNVNANNNASSGIGLVVSSCVGKLRLGTVTCQNNSQYGFAAAPVANGADIVIENLVTSGNTTASAVTSITQGKLVILKSSLAEGSKWIQSSSSHSSGIISWRNFNGTVGDHRSIAIGGGSVNGLVQINSESTIRHTASGLAWRIFVQTDVYVTQNFPFVLPLGKIAVAASQATTVKVWLRRTSTSLVGTLRCRGGQIGGVAADVTDSIGAAIDTWEEQSITFTPNESGTVEIDLVVYGVTNHSMYFDDMSVS
jgi:hypothetical protein